MNYWLVKSGAYWFEGKKFPDQEITDIPELEIVNGIRQIRLLISKLVNEGFIDKGKPSERKINILTYEILQVAGILPDKDIWSNAMNAFIKKQL
ncbi:MAG: hypothetical protein WDN75_01180 [Bacteroidota bacterium]